MTATDERIGDTIGRRQWAALPERCIARFQAAGHTGLAIVNLFAFHDTNPRNLRFAPDAVGPANDDVLRVVTKAGAQTIAAWASTAGCAGAPEKSDPCWTHRCACVSPREANHGTRST